MRKSFWAIFAIVAIAAGILGQAGWSGSATKQYTASISTVSTGASSATYSLTITNHPSSTHRLGSANIALPSGYSSVSLGVVTPPAGKTWTAALGGGVIQLRNPGPGTTNALAAGQSVSVRVTVSPCQPGVVWVTATKQSNDFNGTGNDFTRVGPDPVTGPCAGSPHHLAFGQQPTSTSAGTTISPPVTVRVEDQAGNLVTTSTASIALAIGTNPTGATLNGTKSRAAQGGIATFNDLSLSTGGTGFTLVATSSGLNSATSQPFNVSNITINCPATGCTASASNSTTSVQVTVPGGGSAGSLSITLDPGTNPSPCGEGPSVGSITTVDPPSGYTATNPIEVELVYKNVEGPRIVCKNTGPGTPFHVVPDCTEPQLAPCVIEQEQSGYDLEIELVITSGDPVIDTH